MQLVPLAMMDGGTPCLSTNKPRSRSFSLPSLCVSRHALRGQRSFGHGSVLALPVSANPLHLVILGQSRPPRSHEKAHQVPLLKVQMDRASVTKYLQQASPLTSGAQDRHNRGKEPERWQGSEAQPLPKTLRRLPEISSVVSWTTILTLSPGW
jgi:hypothetical protein